MKGTSTMKRTAVRVASDRVPVDRDGWLFGQPVKERAKPGISVPDTLASLADMLRPQFQLLQLVAKNVNDKQVVYDAYGHDLELLRQTLASLDATVDAAIGASVTFASGGGDEKRRNARKKQLVQIAHDACEEISVDHAFGLNYLDASQDGVSLSLHLQQRLEESLAQGLQRLGLRLKALVDNQCIGLVTWSDFDVCCYHFFVQEERETTLSAQVRQEEGIAEVRTVETRKFRRVQMRIRRVHHLVNARLHNLDDYRGLVPFRVREFLNTVPADVRHLLQVVDGQMTQQEEVATVVGEETGVEQKVIGVYKKDPAITIGDFVLVGWGPEEVDAELAEKRKQRWATAVNVGEWAATLIVLALLVGGGIYGYLWYKHRNEAIAAMKATQAVQLYDQFLQATNGERRLAAKGEPLSLGVPLDMTYKGAAVCSDPNCQSKAEYVVGFNIGSRYLEQHMSRVPHKNAAYGEFDLHHETGLRARLRIVSAEAHQVEYAVIPLSQPEMESTQTK